MKKLFYILVVAVSLLSCEKYLNASDFDGRFTGTLTITGPDFSREIPTELRLSPPNFEVVQNGENFGNGTFKVDDKQIISFTDMKVRVADYDWQAVLSGSYTYQTLGDSLILNKATTNDIIKFKYRLKRVEE